MGLRSVETARALESLRSRSFGEYLNDVTIAFDLPDASIAYASVKVAPGIFVLTGGNGAGKTTVLRGVQSTIDPAKPFPVRFAKVVVHGTSNGSTWTLSRERPERNGDTATIIEAGDAPQNLFFIDASTASQEVVSLIERDPHPEDLVAGIDANEFDDEWRGRLGFVLRRSYEAVRVFENVSLRDDDEPVPIFEFQSAGTSYGTVAAGRGELAAAYLMWSLARVPSRSIVLIEEPENHLATYSQAALMDVLVQLSIDRDVSFVISSHSPQFYSHLPGERVSLVSSSPILRVVNEKPATYIAKSLGLPMSLQAMAVVEDYAAAHVLAALLLELQPELLDAIDIQFALSGESGVDRVVAELNEVRDMRLGMIRVGVFGVYDGDQRAGKGAGLFLPGNSEPELVLKEQSDRWLSDDTGVELGLNPEEFRLALEQHAGLEIHDWFTELSKSMGGTTQVARALCRIGLTDPSFYGHGRSLVSAISGLLS